MSTDTSILVPPRRLGTLLRNARAAAGLGLTDLAERSELGVVDLDDVEQGRRVVDDALLSELVELYGVEDAGLVPERSRLVIDLDEGRIAMSDGASTGVVPAAMVAPDLVLARYLALVYRLRELPLGTPVALRDLDLDVLATALALEPPEVESRLRALMADEETIALDQRRIRRRVLLPLVGVVVAATGVGTLLLVSADEGAEETPQQSGVVGAGTERVADATVADAPDVVTRIGDATVLDEPSEP